MPLSSSDDEVRSKRVCETSVIYLADVLDRVVLGRLISSGLGRSDTRVYVRFVDWGLVSLHQTTCMVGILHTHMY